MVGNFRAIYSRTEDLSKERTFGGPETILKYASTF